MFGAEIKHNSDASPLVKVSEFVYSIVLAVAPNIITCDAIPADETDVDAAKPDLLESIFGIASRFVAKN